jgi:hypothetical protein
MHPTYELSSGRSVEEIAQITAAAGATRQAKQRQETDRAW